MRGSNSWRSVCMRALRLSGAVAGLVLAVAATGCGGKSSSNGGAAHAGGTVRIAEPAGVRPNYVLPIMPGNFTTPTNFQFVNFQFRHLYTYGGRGDISLNEDLSMAEPPVYSADGKSVTITLKPWTWSDGKPVTARDVEFFINLAKSPEAKTTFTAGRFPDNVVSTKVLGDRQIKLNLDAKYGELWYTGNQLSKIVPFPQHAWAKTSDDGAVGDADRTPAGAKQIYAYLERHAKQLGSYASDPLWQVVSGPYRMTEYRTDGFVELARNPRYSGTPKPTIEKVQMLPFTTEDAQLLALRSKQVDVGYLPIPLADQASALKAQGFRVESWPAWRYNGIQTNFGNTGLAGKLRAQLYIRQAFQHMIDQDGWTKNILKGYGYPTYSPVPPGPDSPYKDGVDDAYPFDPGAARTLLEQHGWKVQAGGTSTCERPGSGADQCGAGIPAGAPLKFSLLYISGSETIQQQMAALKSDLGKVGIDLELRGAPADTVFASAVPCPKGKPCTWDMAFWGNGFGYSGPYPSGEMYYPSTPEFAYNNYVNPKTSELVDETIQANDSTALVRYANYQGKDLPQQWVPSPVNQISLVRDGVRGTAPWDPMNLLYPEYWSVS
jgi:peptide/nickel transport system substrate-binding protein